MKAHVYTSAVITSDLVILVINHSVENGVYESGEFTVATEAIREQNIAHFLKIGWRVYFGCNQFEKK